MNDTTVAESATLPPASGALGEEVKAGLREFEEVRGRAGQLLASLTSEQWAWKPARDRWSAGEAIAHINQTNRTYFAAIEQAMQKGRERGILSSGPYRHGLLGEIILRHMEPPPRRRFRTPRVFAPPPGEAGARVLQTYDELFGRAAQLLQEANGLDLGKIHVVSPASRFVRIGLGQAFRLLAAHARRHLWQAQRIIQEPGFPAGAPRAPGSPSILP
jgi:hypothetical protein